MLCWSKIWRNISKTYTVSLSRMSIFWHTLYLHMNIYRVSQIREPNPVSSIKEIFFWNTWYCWAQGLTRFTPTPTLTFLVSSERYGKNKTFLLQCYAMALIFPWLKDIINFVLKLIIYSLFNPFICLSLCLWMSQVFVAKVYPSNHILG